MPYWIELITLGLIAYFVYRLINWLRTKQKRYIPKEVKEAVLKRYFGMCVVCPDNNHHTIEYHHRMEYLYGEIIQKKNLFLFVRIIILW